MWIPIRKVVAFVSSSFFLLLLLLLLPSFATSTSSSSGGQSLRQDNANDQRALQPLVWQNITVDTFDNGSSSSWGSYSSGGSQAKLESKTFFRGIFPSTFSAVVQDKRSPPDSSFFHVNFHDVSLYDDLKISFWMYSLNMKNVEHQFLVEYSMTANGPWYPVQTIDRFQNGVPVERIVIFSASNQNVQGMSAVKLRFRCKGNDSKTKVYVDQIRFQGHLAPPAAPTPSPTLPLTRDEICPIDRLYPPSKYEIFPYIPPKVVLGVEDDLSEISSLVFSNQTDTDGSLYAYVASDKNQFSIKVIRFQRHPQTGLVVMGTATTVATYALNIHYSNSDWEDISLGPCSSAPNADTCIYVGDFGNNNRGGTYVQRHVLKIHKFPEPRFHGSTPKSLESVQVTTILYRYAAPGFTESTFYDAEAMFVDWDSSSGGKGDIYIITKGACGLGRVGRIPASYHQTLLIGNLATTTEVPTGAHIYPMTAVMTTPPKQGDYVTCSIDAFRAWQGADMRRDGRLIALITGQSPPRVYFYPRIAGATVVQALTSTQSTIAASCPYIASTSYGLENERRHEAVAFLADGKSFADTSECHGGGSCRVPIYFWDLIFRDSPDSTFQNNLVPGSNDGLWVTITKDDFETGDHLGSYRNGTRTFASQAYACPLDLNDGKSWSIGIFEHNGAESAITHRNNYDASSYSWLKVTFDFLLDGFDHMDTLFMELSLDGGVTYFIVYDWAMDTQGVTTLRQCYMGNNVVLDAKSFGRTKFSNFVRLRFRTSANAQNDRVYIDNIVFEGHP